MKMTIEIPLDGQVENRLVKPRTIPVPGNPVKAFKDLMVCPEENWDGSFCGDIYSIVRNHAHKIFDYGKKHGIPHQECFDLVEEIEREMFAKITFEITAGIRKYWRKVLFDKAGSPSLDGYVIRSNMSIQGLMSWQINKGYIFFNFYDKNCDFPFPPGLKERLMKMAEEATEEKVALAFDGMKT